MQEQLLHISIWILFIHPQVIINTKSEIDSVSLKKQSQKMSKIKSTIPKNKSILKDSQKSNPMVIGGVILALISIGSLAFVIQTKIF